MENLKKFLLIFALLIFLAIISTALCIHDPNTGEKVDDIRTITDMAGKQVRIPAEVKSVVVTCCGGASHEFAVLGEDDLVKAQPKKCLSDKLLSIVPEYRSTPDVGSFDDVNVEEILNLNPDIVVASITSETGNEMIENAGIPVIRVLTGRATIDNLLEEYAMMGEILGKEKEADRLISYWNGKLGMIDERIISKIPENERKSVYYMNGKILNTDGRDGWGHYFIKAAGGRNVAENITTAHEVNMEELLNWDPDVIIIRQTQNRKLSCVTVREVKINGQLSEIKAVEDGEIYGCPVGTFWWDRPSPESPLGIMWLAKTLYPEEFEDISIEDETRLFYREFYNYNLTDDEIEDIITPASV